ncbi:MAG TPA: nucleotide exchange factor GrpE [Acidobacteriota bacterium]|nr:nucleotide exchange factor GrpE [Acidobacteriota bacterium]HNB70736.1 nucleotide exchange factor GrpE [Acidobacteriota bacterium]HNJ41042.1 nucleotide exchange factor GrpE [Acidobacteriota bacterium]
MSASDLDQDLDHSDDELEDEEAEETLEDLIANLAQELRRVGREVFKVNRAVDRNQELFEDALKELRRINRDATKAASSNDSGAIAQAIFETKASLCKELLGVVDGLELSLTSAKEIVEQLETALDENQTLAEEVAVNFETLSHSLPPEVLAWFSLARTFRWDVTDTINSFHQWLEGQNLIIRRFLTVLAAVGVVPIDSVGNRFTPDRHKAVSVEIRTDVPVGTIIDEEVRGYTLDGKILRFAEVIVTRYE